MSRLLSTMILDTKVQVRNNLYTIGIGVGVVVAFALSQLITSDQMPAVIPTLMLLVIGGSTLLYVAGMILFEKDEGTINASIVSPLSPTEYLLSKIITLTTLATLEAIVMIGGTMLFLSFGQAVTIPNLLVLLVGILAISVMYTLIGIIMIVRFDSITDFIIPLSVVAVIMQLAFLYFLGLIDSPIFLIIPVSAPSMIMRGAYVDLSAGEWIYGIAYTSVLLVGMSIWAYRAFEKHIIMQVG